MRKSFLITLLLSLFFLTGYAKSNKAIDATDLPSKAVKFIKKNFKNSTIMYTKAEGKRKSREYEVVLSTFETIEFDRSGNWTEIHGKKNGVPTNMLSRKMRSYLSKNYKKNKIVKIERKENKFEVELNNDVDLIFDKDGLFIQED